VEAISPGQAREGTPTKAELDSAKRVINRHLKGGGRTYSLSLLNGNGPLLEKILEEYRARGWKVRVVDDFRDGDYLEFSE
jgi:hypothetical protein